MEKLSNSELVRLNSYLRAYAEHLRPSIFVSHINNVKMDVDNLRQKIENELLERMRQEDKQ